jgi:hypothetical protein
MEFSSENLNGVAMVTSGKVHVREIAVTSGNHLWGGVA